MAVVAARAEARIPPAPRSNGMAADYVLGSSARD
jgi:hypothetical protein